MRRSGKRLVERGAAFAMALVFMLAALAGCGVQKQPSAPTHNGSYHIGVNKIGGGTGSDVMFPPELVSRISKDGKPVSNEEIEAEIRAAGDSISSMCYFDDQGYLVVRVNDDQSDNAINWIERSIDVEAQKFLEKSPYYHYRIWHKAEADDADGKPPVMRVWADKDLPRSMIPTVFGMIPALEGFEYYMKDENNKQYDMKILLFDDMANKQVDEHQFMRDKLWDFPYKKFGGQS
ncbi:hypothetical protein OZX67_08145 [Bifidobacterium sp. ESL0728]|uniref:hypothetical protein n=1 Tax=Bifidobacterium sp. ESL0728 TaxID=2983220 RepID=UPI0023F7CF48|nr:hypothetical protein [Bifidobacterium sp. ESL0728]WEV58753.1 hypothetical protein OZX67_08145 [Bifidobacterium sp. ESL0728]